MKRRLFLLMTLTAALVLAAPAFTHAQKLRRGGTVRAAEPERPFFFKDGDRIVVMGDSITEQHLYSNYLEMWTVSRFPAWTLTFRNVGIGGDTSRGGNRRFKRDVLTHKATALTVDFGMNDGGYQNKVVPERFDAYMKGQQGIADQAKKANIRVAFITPQPIERREPGNQLEAYNVTLEKFSAGLKEIADKNGDLFIDQFHPYLAVMNKARATDPKIIITGGDAVHPGPPGQALMAASILRGMNFPSQVSRVSINLKRRKVFAGGTNCSVTNLTSLSGAGVKFERHDNALPFFPAEAKSILKWAPLLEEMNAYGLQIVGLNGGQYEIRLGGKKVAERSAAELAQGVNLAADVLAAGPIAEQVNKVWKAVRDKNRYFHDQIYRGIVLSGKNKDQYEERMKKMPEFDAAVRQALTMRPYLVEVVPAQK